MAGIIAGERTGVSPVLVWWVVKVFDSSGSAYVSAVVEGFQWGLKMVLM